MSKNTIGAAMAALLLVFGPTAAVADNHCEEGRNQTHKLKIRVVDDEPVEISQGGRDAQDLHVCLGDSIEWTLQGEAREFYLEFPEGAPFPGGQYMPARNHKIEVTVESGEPGQAFKYNIGIVGGKVWDPRIIIDD